MRPTTGSEIPRNRRDVVRKSAVFAASIGLISRGLKTASAQGDAPLKIGWSTIYLSPSWTTWMTETSNEIDAEIERMRGEGGEVDYQVFDANGDTPTQIAQIQTMIDQQYDICLLIAGSATALDSVVADAHAAGVVVVNWDSLVTTDELTAKVFEDQVEWGRMTAQWLVDTLDGSGKILAINGPAGVALSEERWSGAKDVFDANPDIEISGTAYIEYNEDAALVELTSLLAAHPDIDGIWCQSGAQASAAMKVLTQHGMALVPIVGENFNGFLRQWRDALGQGFTGFATAGLNWLAVVSLKLAVKAVNGEPVPSAVEIDLPIITDENVAEWANDDVPDDHYPIPDAPSTEDIDRMIADALMAESDDAATPAG